MIELQNQLSAESNAKDVGKIFEVLAEGVSKRSKEQLFGRTEQNKVVVFDRGSHRIGDFVKVKITESSSATLKGLQQCWSFFVNYLFGVSQTLVSEQLKSIHLSPHFSLKSPFSRRHLPS